MRPFLFRPAVLLLLFLVFGCGMGPSGPEAELTELKTGKTVNLKDFKGKVVVVDFWATWCSPCIDTMPNIQKLYNEFVDQGVVFLGVSNEEKSVVKKFEANSEFSYPVYLDEMGQAWERFGISEIPRVVVIGKDGAIRYKGHPGDYDKVRSEIKAAF